MSQVPNDKPWAAKAACGWTPPGFMFPEEGDSTKEADALTLCNGSRAEGTRPCPVRAECLDYALSTQQMFGIWGGKTERSRRSIRRHSRKSELFARN